LSAKPTRPPRENLAPCETEAVLRKARSMVRRGQVPRGDLDDLRQDLTLALLEALKSFVRGEGEREHFARGVVRRAGTKIIRARRAARRDPARVASLDSLADRAAVAGGGPPAREYQVGAALDVREVLARLPEHLRAAAALLDSMTVTKAARELGIPRTTLSDRIGTLREEFARAGLLAYVE
jgi:RNA polymerase sigma factor (sigma-70 family)